MKKIPKSARRHMAGWLLAALAILLCASRPVSRLCALPGKLNLTEGYESQLALPWPAQAWVDGQSAERSESGDGVRLIGRRAGLSHLTVSLMGLLPIKTVSLAVSPGRVLVPGGHSLGVVIEMKGVLVVGASDLGGSVPSPARLAGLKPGDFIESVDGRQVESARQLSQMIQNDGGVTLGVRRDDRLIQVSLRPAYDERDGSYRLGLWTRDSTAGVGTLSFYDPESGWYGALGHAITDLDTGSVLPVRDGGILDNRVAQVKKGTRGTPGELVGDFDPDAEPIGTIELNGPYGIYGAAARPIVNELYPDGLPIMRSGEVRLGPASILTTLDGEGIREYACEIVKLNDQNAPSQRSMVVKVVDPELLSRTGGIVQGMSGSPIIQDGRLAGAVTHVYVNDPTQGFGLYIEWMLDQMEAAQAQTDEAA
ncbi:MAG: SpoIVB peptidase [Clostridiales bacterium]|nr:SpoIVB peptidase [Clostridiales bacterium]